MTPVLAAYPEARGADGGVDRAVLNRLIAADAAVLRRLEAIVHPLVAQARDRFLAAERAKGTAMAVLEVQLLFEVGIDRLVDKTIVVSAPADVQRRRVLARPGMTNARFEQILARQMSDADKRARADFIIDTGVSLDQTRRQVAEVFAKLAGEAEPTH